MSLKVSHPLVIKIWAPILKEGVLPNVTLVMCLTTNHCLHIQMVMKKMSWKSCVEKSLWRPGSLRIFQQHMHWLMVRYTLFCLFTRGQFRPSSTDMACVCLYGVCALMGVGGWWWVWVGGGLVAGGGWWGGGWWGMVGGRCGRGGEWLCLRVC